LIWLNVARRLLVFLNRRFNMSVANLGAKILGGAIGATLGAVGGPVGAAVGGVLGSSAAGKLVPDDKPNGAIS
jgi:hypothetical protein